MHHPILQNYLLRRVQEACSPTKPRLHVQHSAKQDSTAVEFTTPPTHSLVFNRVGHVVTVSDTAAEMSTQVTIVGNDVLGAVLQGVYALGARLGQEFLFLSPDDLGLERPVGDGHDLDTPDGGQ